MKATLTIIFCVACFLFHGQTNWLVGKWTCFGGANHIYNKLPEPNTSVEKEYCKSNWHFKKNGKAVHRSVDSNGRILPKGKKTYDWKLNNTNDTLYLYNDDIKYKTNYLIYKYSATMFMMVRRDEISMGYLYIKK